MNEIRLFIPGEPVPQGRPRATIIYPRGKKPFVSIYDPPECKQYKKLVALRAGKIIGSKSLDESFPIDGPIAIELIFFISRPPSVNRAYPTVTPDLDNLIKSATDALNGIVWTDDKNIVKIDGAKKRYAPAGQVPGFELIMRPYGQEEFDNKQEALAIGD